MKDWQPVFTRILDSPLNEESIAVRWLFVGMLLLKDEDHIVRMGKRGLMKRVNLTLDELDLALKTLLNPSNHADDNQAFEGRMIQEVSDGWLILNGQKYGEMMKAHWRRQQKNQSQNAIRSAQRSTHTSPPIHPNGDPPGAANGSPAASGPLDEIIKFKGYIGEWFSRKPEDPWSYEEESAMAEILRRPHYRDEVKELFDYWKKKDDYRVQSAAKLLSGWTRVLDRARSFKEKPLV